MADSGESIKTNNKGFPFLNKTGEDIDEVFEDWKKYKYSVPVHGAILLNQNLDKCVLVQPFMSRTSWGFPKGKVNKDESAFDCAIREVLEETGFDMSFFADPDAYLEHIFQDHQVRLYIVPGVPEKTVFQPQTRGEIKNIDWFYISDLPSHKKDTVSRENLGLNPNAFFMVMPFLKGLRKWISVARQQQTNPIPEPSAVESPGNKQLQKLLAKEEQRLEQEQKRAAIERRRKQQQDKFQLQHELNHPLRQRPKILKDYQSLKDEEAGHRVSPVMKERDDRPVYKILQRPSEESVTEKSLNPLQQLLSGKLGYGPITTPQPSPPMGVSTPHGVIYHPYAHPQGVIGFNQEHISPRGAPPTPSSSSRSKQQGTATPSEHSWEDKEFQFSSSAFLNFKFDTKSILACLPT